MEGIKKTFARCKKEQRPALVTYVTAGFPTAEETVDILLGMEAGGAGRYFSSSVGIVLTSARPHRTRPSLHRSHRRRTYNPEGKYTGIEEWSYGSFYFGHGTESKEARPESTCALHGLL